MAEALTRVLPTLLGTSSSTIYTAGGASTYSIIRRLVIANVLSTPVNVTVGIGTSNTDTAAKRILSGVTIQPGQTLIEDGFTVLLGHASTPDLLYALCSDANGASIYLAVVTGP